MFKSRRVACYLNNFSGHGEDTENKELKLVFFVTPISQELAEEISTLLADRLFRLDGKTWAPALEITKASFSSINVQMQDIEFHPLPDADKKDDGSLVAGVAISNLRAARPSDSPEFRLEFDAVVPMNRETMRLVEKYYKATVFLSMTPVQREIKFEGGNAEVSVSLQDAADTAPEAEETDGKSAGSGERRGRKRKAAAQ